MRLLRSGKGQFGFGRVNSGGVLSVCGLCFAVIVGR